MNNWWIAALELEGIIDREKAELIAESLRDTIHPDKYADAYNDLKTILDNRRRITQTTIDELRDNLLDIQNTLDGLKKVASKK